ncbi:hypothetical protein C2G38_2107651 [Gigaspora rosea]|uniref:Uncharacterized protein n=1 Tax=Gigaspora rosea TaxID=44941 RepID=A0A397UKZ6_9GLOM|nr:hypothetical protein C2G38_2107651 [Gigaspora rosea]
MLIYQTRGFLHLIHDCARIWWVLEVYWILGRCFFVSYHAVPDCWYFSFSGVITGLASCIVPGVEGREKRFILKFVF